MSKKTIGFIALVGIVVLNNFSCRRPSRTVNEAKRLHEDMCACQDRLCAEEMNVIYQKWLKDNTSARGSKDDLSQIKDAMQNVSTCYERLVTEDK